MNKNIIVKAFFETFPEFKIDQKTIVQLILIANQTRKTAYTPYSHYNVGVALLSKSGKIYHGCNIENVSYTPTIHAEQAAIIEAVVNGETTKDRKFIKTLVVVHGGNSMPCGLCRQVIQEFCDNAVIINADLNGKILNIKLLSELLPNAFTPSYLGIK